MKDLLVPCHVFLNNLLIFLYEDELKWNITVLEECRQNELLCCEMVTTFLVESYKNVYVVSN